MKVRTIVTIDNIDFKIELESVSECRGLNIIVEALKEGTRDCIKPQA